MTYQIARESFYNTLKKDFLTEHDLKDCMVTIQYVGEVCHIDTEAHEMEKALWCRILKQLATSNPVAEVALETSDINFKRSYA